MYIIGLHSTTSIKRLLPHKSLQMVTNLLDLEYSRIYKKDYLKIEQSYFEKQLFCLQQSMVDEKLNNIEIFRRPRLRQVKYK